MGIRFLQHVSDVQCQNDDHSTYRLHIVDHKFAHPLGVKFEKLRIKKHPACALQLQWQLKVILCRPNHDQR